jgi:gamma-glutamylcyclotransferase (GGCT)/AIG2-like uncharacterized protein YtfP
MGMSTTKITGTITTEAAGPGRVRLFVYGTLQPRVGTPMGAWIAERLVRAEPATVAGRLWAVPAGEGGPENEPGGWFPALLPAGPCRRVTGMVCTLRLTRAELGLLDRYEGHEYRRVALVARGLAGRGIAAQAYLWRVGLPPGSRPIADGDFLRWLRAGGRRAFA